MTLMELLAQHGAASWDKQMCLAELLDGTGWNLDARRGILTFGDVLTCSAQILGSEADTAGTWLWAWANESVLPEIAATSRQIQEFGRHNNVSEMTTPEISLENADGHVLSMIASGLCGADAYYRGPYQGGAAFMLLTAPEVARLADSTMPHFIRIFMEFISAVSCPHRPALEAYARYKEYDCDEKADGSLLLIAPSGDHATAVFDAQGRMKDFRAMMFPPNAGGAPGAPKNPWWKLGG